ncbi:hypothetical protein HAX54_040815 [Datura stramonium]|uniref:Uncharacterized protein n=1 Tax=Datura stramonium TaxID=4076 RepID=A0ABS8SKS0_DATST|nr:hypothetical protein [Datura stramonium]
MSCLSFLNSFLSKSYVMFKLDFPTGCVRVGGWQQVLQLICKSQIRVGSTRCRIARREESDGNYKEQFLIDSRNYLRNIHSSELQRPKHSEAYRERLIQGQRCRREIPQTPEAWRSRVDSVSLYQHAGVESSSKFQLIMMIF